MIFIIFAKNDIGIKNAIECQMDFFSHFSQFFIGPCNEFVSKFVRDHVSSVADLTGEVSDLQDSLRANVRYPTIFEKIGN